jgi:hypothetical protein
MLADSWQAAGTFVRASSEMPGMLGCGKLQFTPTIEIQPEATSADSPTGLHVDLHVPQNANPAGLAEADLRGATVTLPAGLTIDPSGANGLEACSPTQIELSGPEPARCPDASKIGSVEVHTPLLDHALKGAVYVAQQGNAGAGQGSNPFGSLLAIYIAVDDPQSGVVVKLAGRVTLDPYTGQLTTTFEKNPQLPFEDLKLELFGGARAALATPQTCGMATTTSLLEPWSHQSSPSEAEGTATAMPSSSFEVTGCANPMPFGPSFTAGTITPLGGRFSPFTLTFSRHDGEQDLSGITVETPPGLLGMLSRVQLCPEPQASSGGCGPQSLIGHTRAAVGSGSRPLWVSGSVFLTGAYKGAPFGLSIVVPAVAGPFNLGNVVVRAAIQVDRHTSALSVTSDPLPQIIDGIPLRTRAVDVAIDRPNFIFNPTNCSRQQITGTMTGALPDGSPGSTVPLSVPFAVANCSSMPFKPKFTVLTHANPTKANGAYLHVKVTSGPGQANIGKVKVDLPKQLPSRLTTLQQACPDATFNANPASCPAGSVVGSATAVTPVLKNPLTGPAYLVSHASAAFPDLVIILQGEGITLDLVGNTDIKKGITISTFNSVPDAPISTFDLMLPEGPHSALAAYGNLCKSKLNMPTAITGQNGAVIKQTTRIAVAGCPKHRKARRAKTHRQGRRPKR